jgi:hypothetical protein
LHVGRCVALELRFEVIGQINVSLMLCVLGKGPNRNLWVDVFIAIKGVGKRFRSAPRIIENDSGDASKRI